MLKLNKAFVLNPLYEADGYKVGHKAMLARNTVREYWTWIPRSLRYMFPSIKKIMSGGQQMVMRYIHSVFQEHFFDKPVEDTEKFVRDMCKYLNMDYNGDHFIELHKLGYLPIKVQSLPEGIFTKPNIPHMTGINTADGYAWLGLYLETLFSKLAWQLPVVATIGAKFKENAIEWVKKTDDKNMWLADYMCHDFHSRGGNPFTSIAAGLGHAFSNHGSDTLNVIEAARYYYDVPEDEVCIGSVNASEHSVTCTGIFYYEKLLREGKMDEAIAEYYSFDAPCDGAVNDPDFKAIAEFLNLRDWLMKFPTGILSVVADTFDLWKLITFILPRLKAEIMARDGKLVVRPDSGDPVDIICGESGLTVRDGVVYEGYFKEDHGNGSWREIVSDTPLPEAKGVIELLYDIFGGDKSDEGYIRLDPHIGAIYGDSITLERQIAIYERLAAKGFAATNIVLGIGSFSYVYMTRDQAGWAAKGAWFEVEETKIENVLDKEGYHLEDVITKTSYNIYKDPITDDGTKKSLKGFQYVFVGEDGEYEVEGEVPEEKAFSEDNVLKVIYEDGKFYNQTSLEEIRNRIKSTH